jgi:4-amino-4-deoxy-L-arabinose transferase-like glycosyltransferase
VRSTLTGFVGALAIIAAGAYLAISVAALLGVASTPSVLKTLAVAGLVVVILLLPPPQAGRWTGGALLGMAAGVAGVFALEAFSANPLLGAGQVGVVIAIPLVLPLLRAGWGGRMSARWLLRAGVTLVMLFVAVALVRAILEGGPLGHDESAYALKSRAWVAGTPDTGWQLHRAPLNSILGVPIVAFTEEEVPLRLVGAFLGAGSLAAVGLVALRLGGPWSAPVAMATVGASLPFLRRSSEFLTDVPSASLLLLIVWLVLRVADDPSANARRVMWLGPLVALAFYMRYQSSLAIMGIAIGALVAWPGVLRLLRRELFLTTGIAVVALVPHLIWASMVTGSPWGVVLVTRDAGGREYLGQGLVDYVRLFPKDLAGPAGAVLMAAGLAWVIWALVGRGAESTQVRRKGLFVLVVVVMSVVPLGLVSHGEPRFVFFPVWLLIAAGSALVVALARRLPSRFLPVAVAVAALMWLPLFTETVRRADRNAEARGETFAVVEEASDFIEFDEAGSCGVLTTYQPQVTWYSTCWTELFRPGHEDLGVGELQGDRLYALLFVNGKREPVGEERQAYVELGPTQVIPARNEAIGDATVVDISEG